MWGSLQTFSRFDEVPTPCWGNQSALPLPIQMLTSSRKTLPNLPRMMFNQITGYHVIQSSWDMKLTITRFYYNTWHIIKRRGSGGILCPFKSWFCHRLAGWHQASYVTSEVSVSSSVKWGWYYYQPHSGLLYRPKLIHVRYVEQYLPLVVCKVSCY